MAVKQDKAARSTKNTLKSPSYFSTVTLQFTPMYIGGQRLGKIIKHKNQSTGALLPQLEWDYTWYVRDAQGNPMAIYTQDFAGAFGGDSTDYVTTITLSEQDIYGSSRLGLIEQNLAKQSTFSANTASNSYGEKVFTGISSVVTPNYTATHITTGAGHQTAGQKRYELTNHLGNVLAVVSDRKTGQQLYEYTYSQGNGTYTWNIQANEYIYTGSGSNFVRGSSTTERTYDSYLPEVLSYSDFYPFHMQMPDRFGGTYRYLGANGQESQTEITGNNSHSTAEYWMYDNRLGRRWNVDPLYYFFPPISPYCTFMNNPIKLNDIFGLAAEDPITIKSGGSWGDKGVEDALSVPESADDGQVIKFEYEPEFKGDISSVTYTYNANTGKWAETLHYTSGGELKHLDVGEMTGYESASLTSLKERSEEAKKNNLVATNGTGKISQNSTNQNSQKVNHAGQQASVVAIDDFKTVVNDIKKMWKKANDNQVSETWRKELGLAEVGVAARTKTVIQKTNATEVKLKTGKNVKRAPLREELSFLKAEQKLLGLAKKYLGTVGTIITVLDLLSSEGGWYDYLKAGMDITMGIVTYSCPACGLIYFGGGLILGY